MISLQILLPFASGLVTLACIAVVLVIIDIVVDKLGDRSPEVVSRWWITALLFIRVLVCVCLVAALAYLLFNPIGIIAIVLGTGAYVRAIFSRRREETESVNHLICLVADHGGSLPNAIEPFAYSCRSAVRRRARDFAYRLRCGLDVETAALRSRLSLMPDTLVAVQLAGGNSLSGQLKTSNWNDDQVTQRSLASDLRWLSWPVSGQLLYLLLLVVICIMLGSFLHTFIYPTIEKIRDDFGYGYFGYGCSAFYDVVHSFYLYWYTGVGVLLILAGIWLLLVVLTAIRPVPFLTRITPWFGSWIRQRNRWIGLRSIAGGLQRGEPLTSILGSATGATRSRWICWRSADALQRLNRGEDSAGALCRSGWVSRAEARWLCAAEANSALPAAMSNLSSQIQRRYDLLWQLRLAWLVPVVTIAVASVVFFQAVVLFVFMTEMIYGLA